MYQYIQPCTSLYQHSTRRYKVVQGGTKWYKVEQQLCMEVQGGTRRYKNYLWWYMIDITGTYWYILGCTDPLQDHFEQYILVHTSMYWDVLKFFALLDCACLLDLLLPFCPAGGSIIKSIASTSMF